MTVIDVDHHDWVTNGDRRPFLLRHDLVDDPRLSQEAVAVLAGRMPLVSVDMNVADNDPISPEQGCPPLDRPGDQVARDIQTLHRWMTVKNLELDPEYRRLLDECLDAADVGLQLGPEMVMREGYIFLSAAHSITPAHVDHEHNLLLQIRGRKKVVIGGFPSVDAEQRHLEFLNSGGYGRTGYPPHEPETFILEPGTGVYVPPRTVHMVENGDELCLSLSLVFHTIELERSARVYQANNKLRRLGISPRPPRQSLIVDRAKSGVVLAWQRLRHMTTR